MACERVGALEKYVEHGRTSFDPRRQPSRSTRINSRLCCDAQKDEWRFADRTIVGPHNRLGHTILRHRCPAREGHLDRWRGQLRQAIAFHRGTGSQSRRLKSPSERNHPKGKNKRSVWSVPVSTFHGAHFAVFPPALIRPCILAGCPKGGTVLDPFAGSGTTAVVAKELGRDAILIDLDPVSVQIQKHRTPAQTLLSVPSESVPSITRSTNPVGSFTHLPHRKQPTLFDDT